MCFPPVGTDESVPWPTRRGSKGEVHREELKRFAKFCETNGCCCITFNYDDFLDEALAQTRSWNPYWVYGFFCQSSSDTIASFEGLERNSVLKLLKLHGSINWRPKLGCSSPVAIDSITHLHNWPVAIVRFPPVSGHLEPEPVMVPPVLSKSLNHNSSFAFFCCFSMTCRPGHAPHEKAAGGQSALGQRTR